MCAIWGFVARRHSRPSLQSLASIVRGNVGRGPHAFGFSWIDARGRLRMYKQTGRLTDYMGALAMARDARMLIGHLRWATHGLPSENINNHPHPADGGWLVHNGVVRNYEQLVRERELFPVSECDSEALGLLMERHVGTFAQRAAKSVRETVGPLAMLGLWPRPATMIAVRRGNPLHLAERPEGVYVATLADGLPGRARSVEDHHVLQLHRWGERITMKGIALPSPVRERASVAFDDEEADGVSRGTLFYRGG